MWEVLVVVGQENLKSRNRSVTVKVRGKVQALKEQQKSATDSRLGPGMLTYCSVSFSSFLAILAEVMLHTFLIELRPGAPLRIFGLYFSI